MSSRLYSSKKLSGMRYSIKHYKVLYLLLMPGIIWYIMFHYVPMVGLLIAFEDFNPYKGFVGIFTGKWVGFKWFQRFFQSSYSSRLITNSLVISLKKVILAFPLPIFLAITLDSINARRYKKLVQTISYLPHFLSAVVICSMVRTLTSIDGGMINAIIKLFGGEPVFFLGNNNTFQGVLVVTTIWSTVGWNSIIYLAAISGIDPMLYEAATVDGAEWHQRIWHITIAGMAPIISLMLILNVGKLLNAGFEQILLLYTPMVYKSGDIIDTYVYREGIMKLNYSYSTAVNVFKSVVALILVFSTNFLAKKIGQEGIW